jgi:hypothetical protein
MAIMHDFKRLTWYLKDHFEKLLKVACLNHSYPIKHKLKDYTMMKIFMTSEALSMGKKPEGDPSRKDVAPITGKAVVMAIFG